MNFLYLFTTKINKSEIRFISLKKVWKNHDFFHAVKLHEKKSIKVYSLSRMSQELCIIHEDLESLTTYL